MFHLRKISILLMMLLAMLFLICGSASAANKTLKAGTASGAIEATVSLPIIIDDPSGVGGIVFTMAYEPNVFEFKGLEQVGKVITDGSKFPNPGYTTEEIKADLFYQVNSDAATGRVMVSAASAQALIGTNLSIFNAKFLIKSGSGAYPINVLQTIIQNPSAGYATPTFLPFLVGTTTPNTQGQYTETNFPIYPTTPIAGSITVNALKYTISGSVIYASIAAAPASGSSVVLKRSTSVGYVFDAQTTVSNTGGYAFANKPAGTYQVFVTSNDPTYYNGQSAPFDVTNANVTVPQITLPAPQRLTGSVTVNGAPLPGLQVKVMNGSTVVGVYPVNADGSFQTPPLPPGSYTLYAIYGSYSPLITAGQANPLTTTLYSIGGNITSSTADPFTVMASSVTGKLQKTTIVPGNSIYTIGNLVPANDYIVSVTGAGIPVTYYDGKTDVTQATAVDITLANKTDANFDLTVINKGTISGTVTENAAGAANIGVYAFETASFALTQVSANGSGVYSFTLSPGTYEVFVIKANNKIFYYKDGGVTQSEAEATKLVLASGANANLTGVNIDITECTNVLTGKVTYKRTDGDPAANVLVTATSTTGNAVAITGQNGAYSLTGLCQGTYQVEMNPLNSKYAIQRATVVVPGQAAQNFIIDTGNVLSGAITESGTGTAVNNAMIYLLDQQTGVLANGRMYFSNGTGDYVIADIANGIYNLNVTQPLYRSYSESDLSITADTTKNIQLVKGYFFDVTVTDGNNANAPLAGALVIVTRNGEVPVYAMTDSSGNCKIYGLSNNSDYIILVQKAGFDRQVKTGQSPAVGGTLVPFSLIRPVDLFNLTGTITSDCTTPNPPVVRAYVLVSSTSKNFFASAITNGSGYYSLTNLPQAADYQFTVVPGGNLQIQIVTSNPDFTNIPNNATVTKDATIPCGYTITGTVTRTGTAPIYVFLYTATDSFVDFTTADGSGVYTFTGLTTGTYKVLAVSSGNSPKWYDNQSTIGTATAVSAGAVSVNITLTP